MSATSRAFACVFVFAITDAGALADALPTDAVERTAVDSADADAAPDTAATHVPPAPPQSTMPTMDSRAMNDAMQMNNDAALASLRVDRLERVIGASDAADAAWKIESTIGGDFDKLAIRSEGVLAHDAVEDGDVELLWRHAAAAFWDTTLGVRRDIGRGATRSWVAFGVQGLAPYWLDVEATAYVGDGGRTAFRLELAHDVRLTQRLVAQPRIELDAYGRDDVRARVGAGVASTTFALSLRYALTRELAPYVGIERNVRYGIAADAARADGLGVRDTVVVAGVRLRY